MNPEGNVWTVEVGPAASLGQWTKWSEWVDRATAESEMKLAQDEGFVARIVRAS